MIDKTSQTWETISAETTKELERVQRLVLMRGVSHDESNYYRGYYAALLKIQALATPPEPEAAIAMIDY